VKGSDNMEIWILAEIINFNKLTNIYEIDDIDKEANERHIISTYHVTSLSIIKANPETDLQDLFTIDIIGNMIISYIFIFIFIIRR
jgi:hypothetical protein